MTLEDAEAVALARITRVVVAGSETREVVRYRTKALRASTSTGAAPATRSSTTSPSTRAGT